MEKVCLDVADVVRDEPIILKNKIEDAREVSAIVGFRAAAALWP
jgi:hypothetical protein